MTGWLTDAQPMLRRLLRVWSTLVSGTVGAQLINLAAFALAARALPLEILGGIAVIQGLVRTVDALLNFRSNVPLTTFGAGFVEAGDKAAFLGLLKAGFLVDLATAIIAAAVAATILAFFAEDLGVPSVLASLAPVYALVILASITGFYLTVLRIFDRYSGIAMGEVGGALFRLGAMAIAVSVEAAPMWFLLAWLVADIMVHVFPMGLALRILRRRGYGALLQGSARAALARVPNFWRMLIKTNLAESVRSLSHHGDVVILGWLAGPSAAGLLRIAKAWSGPVAQLGHPIQQAALPELARLHSTGDMKRFYRDGLLYCLAGAAFGASALIGAWLFGPLLILAVAGAAVEGAEPVLIALVAGQACALGGAALMPMAAAQDRMGEFLWIALGAVVIFLLTVGPAITAWGALGVGLAALAQNAFWLLAAAGALFRRWRRADQPPRAR